MHYLPAAGLFIAFCAALLSPYGRKLLLAMTAVMTVIAGCAYTVHERQFANSDSWNGLYSVPSQGAPAK